METFEHIITLICPLVAYLAGRTDGFIRGVRSAVVTINEINQRGSNVDVIK